MIDTVQIRIQGKRFTVFNNAPFTQVFSYRTFDDLSEIEKARFRSNTLHLRHFILHPEKDGGSKSHIRVEVYEKPNRAKETLEYELVLKTSLPKLIFGNNLNELAASDGARVFAALRRRLGEYGIVVSLAALADAQLSVCHFGKNIVLPGRIRARPIIKALSKLDRGKAYDTHLDERIRDRNNAQSLRIASGVREFSFYDKVDEMRLKTKRGVAGRQSPYEKKMPELYGLDETEVFRFEYRLNKFQTIKKEINPLLGRSYDTPVTLGCLFNESLWKSLLNNAWLDLVNRPDSQLALFASDDLLDLFLKISENAARRGTSGHSQNQSLWSYGIAALIKAHGAKTVRHEYGRIWSEKATKRFEKKIKIASDLLQGMQPLDGIVFITDALKQFQRTTLETLKYGSL